MRAACNGYESTCEFLLEQHVNVNATQTSTGMTALHHAAARSNMQIVKLLLNKGADVTMRVHAGASDEAGCTPLGIAIRNANALCVRVLLAGGADPNEWDKVRENRACSVYPLACVYLRCIVGGCVGDCSRMCLCLPQRLSVGMNTQRWPCWKEVQLLIQRYVRGDAWSAPLVDAHGCVCILLGAGTGVTLATCGAIQHGPGCSSSHPERRIG